MDRRAFLKNSSIVAGGSALGLLAPSRLVAQTHYPYGIQLYTLREDMPDDPQAVLRQLAQFGYSQIESYEGPQGMFWGQSPARFAAYVRDLGMDLVASHCSINEGFEQKASDAAEAGMQYLICPLIGPQASMDDYRRYADTFNRCGEICRSNGLGFAYHNHHYSFFNMTNDSTGGESLKPQDILMQNTDPDLVDFELDIFWLVAAGEDPIHWLRKYPGRFPFSHVKDRLANMPADSFSATTTLGQGIIDYPSILPVAYELGMRWFMVEQESYAGTTPLDSSRDNAVYMQQFRFG
ncbi:sugar phosphate isomerase/epimerase family protein [Pseudohongiella spirulinae]|uniref:Sugar phosphate isomerase n=1 Tax=Pseudohongiella spirulinae TaxID=1249552 RepID=A0A0S2KEY7_9GAMM|nr:sugar phosphate isomerase/epimerase [Pseudohongiella spirulinae]ALO46877.1 sugar phosphate isomerase [Pseudohongiella spirulinae]